MYVPSSEIVDLCSTSEEEFSWSGDILIRDDSSLDSWQEWQERANKR